MTRCAKFCSTVIKAELYQVDTRLKLQEIASRNTFTVPDARGTFVLKSARTIGRIETGKPAALRAGHWRNAPQNYSVSISTRNRALFYGKCLDVISVDA